MLSQQCLGNETDIAVLVYKTERPRLGDHGRFDRGEARKWRISSQANTLVPSLTRAWPCKPRDKRERPTLGVRARTPDYCKWYLAGPHTSAAF